MTDEKRPETHHSTDRAYRVQVRALGKSLSYGDRHYIGHEWGDIPIVHFQSNVMHGCANDDERDKLTRSHSYYGAISLAAAFLAHQPFMNQHKAEVRIVEYERQTDTKMTELEIRPFPDEIDEIFARAGYADRVDKVRASEGQKHD